MVQVLRCALQTPENVKEKVQSSRISIREAFRAKNRSRTIAIAGLLAGVYAVATVALGTTSFLALNLRLSNILIGVVPIVGWPAVFGLSLGVFLSNTVSPLGPIDLLSSIVSFCGLTAIQLLKPRSAFSGFLIYSVLLSIWVTFEIEIVTSAPLYPIIYLVPAGVSVVVLALAYPFYRALLKTSLARRFEEVNA